MPQLAISALGNLRVTLDGQLVEGFQTDKARALLVYLAVESRQPHRREALAGLLWPDTPEANARHSLSQVLSNLRGVVGDRRAALTDRPCYFETTRSSVALTAGDDGCWVDARRFETLLGQLPLRTPKAIEETEGFEALSRAVGLYQGPFLDGFSLGDAYPFEEWMLLQRERFERRAIRALQALTEAHTGAGAYELALRHAWRWVELDPWQERAHRALIRLLALTGQRSAALRQYELCCRALEEELGVEPEPETVALLKRVRDGSLAPERAVGATVVAAAVAGTPARTAETAEPRHNLPVQLQPLVGRAAELERIHAYLSDPACRLLTLVGPGGIGKTRLALGAAHAELGAFGDGVYLVSLAQVATGDGIIPAVAQAIGLAITPRDLPPRQQLRDYAAGKAMLLVLDNMEHLVVGVDLITDLLAAAPELKVLVISRARLGALSETVMRVEPLALPGDVADPGEHVAEAAAVQLFVQGARRTRPDFRLTPTTAPVVAQICREVDGMPLALLHAASWCHMLSVPEILDELTGKRTAAEEGAMGFLQAQWRDVPRRHRSMRAVFDHSWRLLSRREQAVMVALAVFRGAISVDAAFYVAEATLVELRRLVDQSMLEPAAGSAYEIHPLLREYLLDRLGRDAAAETTAHDRHAAHYVGVLRRWWSAAKGPSQVSALADMDARIDDARAAWDWILAQGDLDQLAQAVDGLCLYYMRRGRLEEADRLCREAVTQLDGTRHHSDAAEASRLRLIARLLLWQSEAQLGPAAEEMVDRALTVLAMPALHAIDVRVARGWALRRRGDLLLNSDRDAARATYEESLALLEATDDWWEAARTLDRLADLELLFADFDAAGRHSEALLTIARAHGDLHAMAWGLHALAGKTLYQSQLQRSIELATESLAVRRELGDPHEVVVGLQYLGTRWVLAGRLALAMPLYEEAVTILDRLGRPAPYPRGVQAWGLMLDGRYADAEALAQRAVREAEAAGERRLVAWSSHVLGSLALARGSVDEAIARLSQSAEEFHALNEWIYWGMVFSFLGYAHYVAGHREQARGIFVEALKVGVKAGIPPILACALPGMTLLYVDAGRVERAVALRAVVRQCCLFVVSSTWFADIAGSDYRAALDALSPEQIEAIESRVLLSDMPAEARSVLQEVAAGTGP